LHVRKIIAGISAKKKTKHSVLCQVSRIASLECHDEIQRALLCLIIHIPCISMMIEALIPCPETWPVRLSDQPWTKGHYW